MPYLMQLQSDCDDYGLLGNILTNHTDRRVSRFLRFTCHVEFRILRYGFGPELRELGSSTQQPGSSPCMCAIGRVVTICACCPPVHQRECATTATRRATLQ